ncbi:hypothetical protein K2X05_08670 [bacterium]|nr:hypothetical protein [bacterium]
MVDNLLVDFIGPFSLVKIVDEAKDILKREFDLGKISKAEYNRIVKKLERGLKNYLLGNLKRSQKSFNNALKQTLRGNNGLSDIIELVDLMESSVGIVEDLIDL